MENKYSYLKRHHKALLATANPAIFRVRSGDIKLNTKKALLGSGNKPQAKRIAPNTPSERKFPALSMPYSEFSTAKIRHIYGSTQFSNIQFGRLINFRDENVVLSSADVSPIERRRSYRGSPDETIVTLVGVLKKNNRY